MKLQMNSFLRPKFFSIVAPVTFSSILSRSFADSSPKSNLDITIYQYKICPYCNRPKTYLDYLKVPYKTVEVNPITKSEISFSKEHKKVPIMSLDGKIVVDSKLIIETLEYELSKDPQKSKIINDLNSADCEKWISWSERLAVMIYPNITRNFEESWECFDYTSKVDSWNIFSRYSNRILGPIAMYFANGKIKKKYGIVNEREELLNYLQEWTSAIEGKQFLHGDRPSLPDLLVFGVLRSIYGLKTFDEIMKNDIIKNWYFRLDGLMK